MKRKLFTGWYRGERPFSKKEFEASYVKQGDKKFTYDMYLKAIAQAERRKMKKIKKPKRIAQSYSLLGLPRTTPLFKTSRRLL